jgi:hypothetical protein
MTRARKWQLKQRSLGNCMWCGEPADGFARCEKHREWFRIYAKARRLKNVLEERALERSRAKILREKNPAKFRLKSRAYYAKNVPKMRRLAVESRKRNIEKARARDKARRPQILKRKKERWVSDPAYKMGQKLRHYLWSALKQKKGEKSASAIKLLGCSLEDFIIYIESKFDVGMSWKNWGKGDDKWNLDHIIPIAIFDMNLPSHQKRAFHFSNYQPLWEPDNHSKGAKTPPAHQFEML